MLKILRYEIVQLYLSFLHAKDTIELLVEALLDADWGGVLAIFTSFIEFKASNSWEWEGMFTRNVANI